jgi:phage terminase small subunit
MPPRGKKSKANAKAKPQAKEKPAPREERGPFRGKPAELTDKQWMFCLEYIVDLNGTQAAIRAGYPAESAGQVAYENLRKPHIAEAISELIAERTGVTRTTVLNELGRIGFADIRKVVSWRPEIALEEVDGPDTDPKEVLVSRVLVKASHSIDDDTAAAIKSVSQGANGVIKVEMHDKPNALEKIARALGMYQDGGQVNVDLTPTIIVRNSHESGSA